MFPKHLFHAGLALCIAAPGLVAQDPMPRDDSTQRRAPVSSSKLLKGTDLMGQSVQNAQGEDCAEVKDLLLARDGSVRALILEVDDVDGRVIVPVDIVVPQLDVHADVPEERAHVGELTGLKLVVDAAELRSAPNLRGMDEQTPISRERVMSAFKHFGRELPEALHGGDERTPGEGRASGGKAGVDSDGARTAEGRNPHEKNGQFCRASKLLESSVRNAKDEELGDIEDIAVSLQNDRVAYAVLAHGGLAGIGEKRFAVPYESLQGSMTEHDVLELAVAARELERKLGFEDWPAAADRETFAAGTASRPRDEQDRSSKEREGSTDRSRG